jgi:hypothetical protein
MDFYILDEQDRPLLVNQTEYDRWHKSLPDDIMKTSFGFTLARDETKGVCVSTVYLGMDHGYGEGLPVLWETMVFTDDERDGYSERATSRSEALESHRKFCEKYIGAL